MNFAHDLLRGLLALLLFLPLALALELGLRARPVAVAALQRLADGEPPAPALVALLGGGLLLAALGALDPAAGLLGRGVVLLAAFLGLALGPGVGGLLRAGLGRRFRLARRLRLGGGGFRARLGRAGRRGLLGLLLAAALLLLGLELLAGLFLGLPALFLFLAALGLFLGLATAALTTGARTTAARTVVARTTAAEPARAPAERHRPADAATDRNTTRRRAHAAGGTHEQAHQTSAGAI
ncbi:hypothetical protein [Rhodovibrio sodomensis]|uniref:hypothetical protein n=1 Tax=Rhodovibrio sodomensis TaxID=1088 RepID=UPI001F5B080F|nr:hypothetical protein [Rhodovibrio sodomensis]